MIKYLFILSWLNTQYYTPLYTLSSHSIHISYITLSVVFPIVYFLYVLHIAHVRIVSVIIRSVVHRPCFIIALSRYYCDTDTTNKHNIIIYFVQLLSSDNSLEDVRAND